MKKLRILRIVRRLASKNPRKILTARTRDFKRHISFRNSRMKMTLFTSGYSVLVKIDLPSSIYVVFMLKIERKSSNQ